MDSTERVTSRRWPRRWNAFDRAAETAMRTNAPQGLQAPVRQAVSLPERRVTARTVRGRDGETQTLYRVKGREYSSVEAPSSGVEDSA